MSMLCCWVEVLTDHPILPLQRLAERPKEWTPGSANFEVGSPENLSVGMSLMDSANS